MADNWTTDQKEKTNEEPQDLEKLADFSSFVSPEKFNISANLRDQLFTTPLEKSVIDSSSKDDILQIIHFLQNHIIQQNAKHTEGINQLRETEEKLKNHQIESTRREQVVVMRLAAKEQAMQEYASQIRLLRSNIIPNGNQLRSTLLDPAVNLIIKKMKKELDETKKKLEDTQNDLNAWKFTPDSNTGKRLMAKCRMLYQENEELGKMISSGKLAKLESDLALQRSLTDEMKKSQSELDELVQELDEDVEGMQSTIYYLQQQLRDNENQIKESEKVLAKNSDEISQPPPEKKQKFDEEISENNEKDSSNIIEKSETDADISNSNLEQMDTSTDLEIAA